MNILILHRMGSPKYWRHAVAELELALPKYAPEHNYLVHNVLLPLPNFVKDMNFHGIILGPTFLGARYHPLQYRLFLKKYSFIKYSNAFKIALPQDDYYCSALLDRWVTDWKMDKVYTVCPEHWETLYPGFLKSGGNLALGYTGYITSELIQRSMHPKRHHYRPVEVCYRASGKPFLMNRLGLLKSELGYKFLEAFSEENLITDISTNRKDIIPGEKWLDFIENARFTLGSQSGCSLLDPVGDIRTCVNNYILKNPNATFEEVEANCFPGKDGKMIFTAISPRVFEAGLLKTGQILTPGPYSGIIHPWEHYIPLLEDFSNKQEVLKAIRDLKFLEQITSSCKEALLSSSELRMETHISNLLSDIGNGTQRRNIPSDEEAFKRALKKYTVQINITSGFVWLLQDTVFFLNKHFPSINRIYN